MVIKIIILIDFKHFIKALLLINFLINLKKNTIILSRNIEGGVIIDLLPKK